MTVTPGGERVLKHKRRYCRSAGCTRIVKSQGLCQRHGAKPRMCKIASCGKQAQGNFDGMCKSHFKSFKHGGPSLIALPCIQEENTLMPSVPSSSQEMFLLPTSCSESVRDHILPSSVGWKPQCGGTPMPLVSFLESGCATKTAGWHRNEERTARGFPIVDDSEASPPMEPWEMDLCGKEVLLLTGMADESFGVLAVAWGQPEGFHETVAATVFGVQPHEGDSSSSGGAPSDDDMEDLICGDLSYIEALAADLLNFDEENDHQGSHHHHRLMSFEQIDEHLLDKHPSVHPTTTAVDVANVSHWEL